MSPEPPPTTLSRLGKLASLTGVSRAGSIGRDWTDQEGRPMALEKLASDCREGPCPTIWRRKEDGRYLIQGFRVLDAGERAAMNLPANEDVVEVTPELLEGYFGASGR
jgi:hypothetical protein